MSVCCECCVMSGRGLCDGLITRPEESCRLRWVVVCVWSRNFIITKALAQWWLSHQKQLFHLIATSLKDSHYMPKHVGCRIVRNDCPFTVLLLLEWLLWTTLLHITWLTSDSTVMSRQDIVTLQRQILEKPSQYCYSNFWHKINIQAWPLYGIFNRNNWLNIL